MFKKDDYWKPLTPEEAKSKLEEQIERTKKRAVQNIKNAGQTIVDNAERMLGGYKYQTGSLEICIKISVVGNMTPVITVNQKLIPDHVCED